MNWFLVFYVIFGFVWVFGMVISCSLAEDMDNNSNDDDCFMNVVGGMEMGIVVMGGVGVSEVGTGGIVGAGMGGGEVFVLIGWQVDGDAV